MAALKRIFRLWPAWILSIATLMVVYAVAPQQLPLLAYKAAFVTFGAINGYWLHVWTMGHLTDFDAPESISELTLTGVGVDQNGRWRRAVYMVGTAMAYALAA